MICVTIQIMDVCCPAQTTCFHCRRDDGDGDENGDGDGEVTIMGVGNTLEIGDGSY